MTQPTAIITPITTHPNTLYHHLKHLNYFMFLDSQSNPQQHISIMAWNPYATLNYQNQKCQVQLYHPKLTQTQNPTPSTQNPFDIIQELIMICPNTQIENSPFNGGAIGYIAYNAHPLTTSKPIPYQDTKIPSIDIGFYNQFIITNQQKQPMNWMTLSYK